jgi:hypothetical protein
VRLDGPLIDLTEVPIRQEIENRHIALLLEHGLEHWICTRSPQAAVSSPRRSPPTCSTAVPALSAYDGAAELDRFLHELLPGMTATLTGRDWPPATVDGDQAPTSRPRPGAVQRSPNGSATRIGVKHQNIAKWSPRSHAGCLAEGKGFADADQKLRHSCPSGQGADEVAARR